MKKLSCNELGACQARKPRCAGCTCKPFPFAPGVIDVAPARVWRLIDLAGAIALVSAAFFVAGYVKGVWL